MRRRSGPSLAYANRALVLPVPALGAVLLAALGGCTGSPAVVPALDDLPTSAADIFQEPDRTLVVVNGASITRREFVDRALGMLGRNSLLSEVIKEELFLQEAGRRGIEVSAEEVEEAVGAEVDSMARALGYGDAASGRARLADLYEIQGMHLEDLQSDLRSRLPVHLVMAKVTASMRQADDANLREFYRRTRRHFARHIAYAFPSVTDDPTPAQAQARQQALEKARRAAERVRRGEIDFGELARAESDDHVTRRFGGDLGPITRDAPMDPELKKAILSLRPGEVSDPIENPRGGFHIVQVTRVEPAEPFEEVRERLRAEYLGREPDVEEIRDAYFRLRKEARIEMGSGLDTE